MEIIETRSLCGKIWRIKSSGQPGPAVKNRLGGGAESEVPLHAVTKETDACRQASCKSDDTMLQPPETGSFWLLGITPREMDVSGFTPG